MGGEICFRKGYERGPYFEIKCIKEDIITKEAKGEDASFQRSLLKSWAKYPGYEGAKEALAACRSREKSNLGRVRR